MLASADDRGEILLWDLATGRLTKRMRGHGRGGIWSLDWSVESTVSRIGLSMEPPRPIALRRSDRPALPCELAANVSKVDLRKCIMRE